MNDLENKIHGCSFFRNFSSKTARISLENFDFHLLDKKVLPSHIELDQKTALKMYTDMQTIRSFENKANSLYKNREIKGFCHLATGQEACAVGLEYSINKDDIVCQTYRMHGTAYMRGASIKEVLGELCQKKCGSSKGKGGSMHFYGKNLYGGYGIVGSQVPIGVGAGFAMKYLNEDKVSVALYGDGAANQGQVYEAFNMAKLYELPVVFICENNLYAMGTSVERASACTDFYTRGQYIPGIRINSQDLASVLAGTRFAVEWARKNKSPILLEYKTYRFFGHSMSDPGLRTRDEVSDKRTSNDPIKIFQHKLIDSKLLKEDEFEKIDDEIDKNVENIAEELKNEPEPDPDTLFEDIYIEYTGDLSKVRGRDPNEIHYIKNT